MASKGYLLRKKTHKRAIANIKRTIKRGSGLYVIGTRHTFSTGLVREALFACATPETTHLISFEDPLELHDESHVKAELFLERYESFRDFLNNGRLENEPPYLLQRHVCGQLDFEVHVFRALITPVSQGAEKVEVGHTAIGLYNTYLVNVYGRNDPELREMLCRGPTFNPDPAWAEEIGRGLKSLVQKKIVTMSIFGSWWVTDRLWDHCREIGVSYLLDITMREKIMQRKKNG